jgi:UDP-N-acetylmuramate dehydrogenase
MNERQRLELAGILSEGIGFNCPMNQYTTFRVGGRAEAVCFPSELTLLQQTVSYLHSEGIPYLVAGKGSNLLVRDGGIDGVVIILKGNLAAVEMPGDKDNILLGGGGLAIVELLSYCGREGLAGLEFLAGIPGSVGGAVFMNAGAFGKEIGSMIQEVRVVTAGGERVVIQGSQMHFSYRRSSLPEGAVIYGVKFKLDKDSRNKISGRILGYLQRRKEGQPLDLPSGGSVFRNPPGDYAGRLIENAGLKGTTIGGAMISPKHANFIVNTGNAKASDIIALMNLARDKVRDETGIILDTEIEVIGE